MKKFCIISLISFFLDRIIKILIISLNVGRIAIVDGFFAITPAYNYGAAWSMLSGHRWLLIIISIALLVVLYFMLIRGKKLNKYEEITYGLLIGGIFGNLIDRIIYGYVIDYLDFNIFGYNFPIFNLADSLIIISIIMLIIDVIRGDTRDSR